MIALFYKTGGPPAVIYNDPKPRVYPLSTYAKFSEKITFSIS